MKIKRFLSILLSLVLVLGMLPGMSLTASAADSTTEITPSNTSGTMTITLTIAAAQTEELLTTITATGKEQASYNPENLATVSFSYTAGGSSAYLANWGWWGYGWTATVAPANGYTITKCVFYDDANRTATDSEAPFVVETTEEDKTPRINGTPIDGGNKQSKGLKKIEVYGYATPASSYSVTITAGDHMTKTAGSGDAEQTGLTGAMTDVVYTADNGYYYPTDYTAAEVSGIKVTRDSYTQITVSGTPTADAAIALTAPTAKTTPAAPTTAAAVDCTTSDNNDGKLTGVTAAMEYKKSDATEWTAGTGSDITGLVPGTYYVRVKATDTTNASDNQELTIKGFISYTVTFKVVNGKWNEGEGDAATADKTVTLTGYEGDTLKLAADQIPTVGTKPNDTYKAGSWDVTPSADTAITADTTYTYTYTAKKTQTITASDVTATYGDTGKKVTASLTTGNGTLSYAVKSGSDVIDVDAATGALTIKKAGTAVVTVTASETNTGGTGGKGYASATKDVTVTINKKALTIKAKDQSIYVGGTVPTLGSDSYTVMGLVGTDTLTTNPTLAYSSTPDNTKAGTYTITPSDASAGDNYTIMYQNGTLTISRRSSGGDSSSSSSDSSSTSTSTTTTTTTTDATSNPDASTTSGTATVTTTKNADGSTTEKTTETATKSGEDGSKTEVKAEVTTTTKSNRDGTTTAATTSTETATTTAADGSKTVTETKTEAKETLNKSGNGTVEAKTTETVKDANGKVTATTVTESKGTVETATDGTKTTTTTNTAVTTDAAGNKTTVVTTEKATVTTDGNTGKVVSDESGKVVSVEAKISETAAESAAKSGETVTLPVTVTAAQSAEDATPVAITVPKAAESVKVEIPVEDVKPGTVAVIVHEDGTEEIVKTSTSSEGGVVLALESGASVKIVDNTKTFNDVDGDEWYAGNVAWASSREVMNGVGNNTFAPNEDTNRAMVTQILYNLDDGKASGAVPTFNDVSTNDWYADSVAWAVENGVARGEGASFGANDPVTREQLAVMLYNYAGKKGYDVSTKGDISRFADNGSTSAWASDAMAWAVGVGIINGTRDANGTANLNPQGNASRAQVTAMTERFCQKTAK